MGFSVRTSKIQKNTRTRRPAKSPSSSQVCETLGQAAGILNGMGFSVDSKILSAARSAGLPGFRGARVDLEKLVPKLRQWIERSRHDKGSLLYKRKIETELLEERLGALREKNRAERARYVSAVEFEQWRSAKANQIETVLRTRLQKRWGPQIVGSRAIEISSKVDAVIGEIFDDIRKPSGQQHRSKKQ